VELEIPRLKVGKVCLHIQLRIVGPVSLDPLWKKPSDLHITRARHILP